MNHFTDHVQLQSNNIHKTDHTQFPLYSLLEKSAEQYGERTAVISDDENFLSYTELKKQVDQLAGAWDSLGLKKGNRIGLMVSNRPDYIISYYAAQRLGLIVVQINPRYTARELLQIISNSHMNYLVTEEKQLQTVEEVRVGSPLKHVFVSGSTESNSNSLKYLINRSRAIQKEIAIDVKEEKRCGCNSIHQAAPQGR